MEKESLYIYRVNKIGQNLLFPNDEYPAKLGEYTYTAQRMGGAPTLTATLNYPLCLDEEWSNEEFVEFKGEKYYIDQTPSSSKDNKSVMYKHELRFISERTILENVLFLDVVTEGADTFHSNSTNIKFMGDVHELVARLNASMKKSGIVDYSVVVDEDVTSETKMVSLENAYLSEGIDAIHTVFGLPYYFVGRVCHVGDAENTIETPFEYRNGLISVKKTNTNQKIVTRITGVGSSENIPFYYPNDTQFGNITNIPTGFDKSLIKSINYDLLALKTSGFLSKTFKWKFSDEVWGERAKSITFNSSGRVKTFEVLCTIMGEQGSTFEYHPKLSISTIDSNVYESISRRSYFNGTELRDAQGTVDSGFWYNVTIPASGQAYVLKTVWTIGVEQSALPTTRKITDLSTITGLNPYDRWEYTENSKTKYVKYEDAGIWLANKTAIHWGDTLAFSSVRVEPIANLMPSIYRETDGEKRFYNALNDTYTIPGTTNKYTFANPYTQANIKEHKQDFEDIKPTIEGVENSLGLPFGEIADIAFDDNDSDALGTGESNRVFNGTDEYVHSYFYIKLNIYNGEFGFNLFEQALEGGTAVINMTSGNCAACAFQIGVTYKDSEPFRAFNPVLTDVNGNLPSGDFEQKVTSNTPKYVERQQDTSQNMVWIAVKKETSTFGVIMPNATKNYRPKKGDKFVITGIKMPKSLVLAAEKKLEDELIKYLYKHNKEKFAFSVEFSRVFLAENPNIANRIKENSRLSIRYNNKVYTTYVNSYTCKADKKCLYNISVELSDELWINELSSLKQSIKDTLGKITNTGNKLGAIDKGLSAVEKSQLAADNAIDMLNSDATLTLIEKLSLLKQYQQITGHILLTPQFPAYKSDSEAGELLASANEVGVTDAGRITPIGTYKDNIDTLRTILKTYKVDTRQNSTYAEINDDGEYVYRAEINNAFYNYFLAKAALEAAIQGKQKSSITEVNNYVNSIKDDLQGQIDGRIDSFFEDYDPTLTNKPASEWTTDEMKAAHLNDTFTNLETGASWRWTKNGTVYSWTPIADTATQKALEQAGKAQAAADGKSTIFSVKPTSYAKGDMWILESDTVHTAGKKGYILTATTASTVYDAAHWVKNVEYTDDTEANKANGILIDPEKLRNHLLDNAGKVGFTNWFNNTGTVNAAGKPILRFPQLNDTGDDYADNDIKLKLTGDTLMPDINETTGIVSWTRQPALTGGLPPATKIKPIKGIDYNDGADGVSIIFKGSFASHPDNPQNGWSYYNTTDKKSYVYQGGAWFQMSVDGVDGKNGKDGTDGVPGKDGKDGTTTYTWIRYADNAQGGGMSNDPTGKEYIGFAYNKTTAEESDTPSDYTWSLIKGTDGIDGTPGKDGTTTYTWVAYSDNADGTGMYQTPKDSTKYIGIATNKTTATESDNPKDYTWSKFKGEDGMSIVFKGDLATPPANPKINWTYRDTDDGKVYIYNGTAWELMVADGSDGTNGANGTDGLSVFITYNDSKTKPSKPTGNGTTGGWHTDATDAAIWMSQKVAASATEGTWGEPIKVKGADGISSYTHIRYSANADGSGMTPKPQANTKYTGIAVTTSATPPTDNTKYQWAETRGTDGTPGDNGYLHIAYANSADGKTDFSTSIPTDKLYIGQYTDNTQADSTDPTKYKWTKIKGDTIEPYEVDGFIRWKIADPGSITLPKDVAIVPKINSVGNWSLGGVDLGKPSRGQAGKTAFEYAKEGGYTLTETEFNRDMSSAYSTAVGANALAQTADSKALGAQNLANTANQAASTAQTTANKATTLANKAQQTADNIQVGGRNLILKSQEYIRAYWNIGQGAWIMEQGKYVGIKNNTTAAITAQAADSLNIRAKITTPKTGDIITVSLEYMATFDSADGFWMQLSLATEESTNAYQVGRSEKQPTKANVWKQASFTATVTQDFDDTKWINKRVIFAKSSNVSMPAGAELRVRNPKIEYGNRATSWTPAPEDVEAEIQAVDARIDEWAADGKFSPAEKKGLKEEIVRIGAEKSQITTDAEKYSVSATAYTTAYNNYNNVLASATSSPTTITAVPTNFNTYQNAYYSARTTILNAIQTAAKQSSTDVLNNPLSLSGKLLTSDTDRVNFLAAINQQSGKSFNRLILTDSTGNDFADKNLKEKLRGVGIDVVKNQYAVSSNGTTAPTVWSDSIPAMSATNKFLWNKEVVTKTDGTTASTTARVISVYSKDGAAGKGISKITEYYLATSASNGVTTSTSGWTTTIQTVTAAKKYLWNYEKIEYTEGSPTVSTPVIIGTYGDKGDKGDTTIRVGVAFQPDAAGSYFYDNFSDYALAIHNVEPIPIPTGTIKLSYIGGSNPSTGAAGGSNLSITGYDANLKKISTPNGDSSIWHFNSKTVTLESSVKYIGIVIATRNWSELTTPSTLNTFLNNLKLQLTLSDGTIIDSKWLKGELGARLTYELPKNKGFLDTDLEGVFAINDSNKAQFYDSSNYICLSKLPKGRVLRFEIGGSANKIKIDNDIRNAGETPRFCQFIQTPYFTVGDSQVYNELWNGSLSPPATTTWGSMCQSWLWYGGRTTGGGTQCLVPAQDAAIYSGKQVLISKGCSTFIRNNRTIALADI